MCIERRAYSSVRLHRSCSVHSGAVGLRRGERRSQDAASPTAGAGGKKPLTVNELKKLIRALPEPSKTIVSVLVRTGLRIGELLALRWMDVDFRLREIRVERNVYEGHFDEPKTKSSRRRVPLSPAAASLLRARRSKGVTPGELVFASRTGTPLSRRNLLQRQLQPAADALGFVGVTWHSFRHVNATLLDSARTPLGTVQNILGHASSEVTRGVYLHAIPTEARNAVTKLDRLLGAKKFGPKSDSSCKRGKARAAVNY